MEANHEILRAIKLVRPLPDVAMRTLRLVQSQDYRIDELVALVRTDPTLVARVLRLCNSAMQGLDREVTGIGDAITWLGSRNLVQLVMASCSASTFASVRSSQYANPTTLWHHSVACAVTCQVLAQVHGEVPAATAFTAGILHDVGRIALSQVADEARIAAALAHQHERAIADPLPIERSMFGSDHAEAAGLVAAAWRLPTVFVAALRDHHDETRLADSYVLTALLHTAEQLVHGIGVGSTFPPLTGRVAPVAMERLDLRADDLKAVTADAIDALARAAELLNLELPGNR
jgi:HD-like signal output (HDOD) protein